MRKSAPARPLEDILKDLSVSLGKRELYDLAAISGQWVKLAGKVMAQASTPAKLYNKTLVLEVSEPVWADSISYMKGQIIEKVNGALGKEAVRNIKTALKKKDARADKPGREEISDPANLPSSALREVEEALKYIEDSELRSIFKRVILKDVGLKYSLNKEKR